MISLKSLGGGKEVNAQQLWTEHRSNERIVTLKEALLQSAYVL